MKLVSASESPLAVTWVHDWTISVSARSRRRLSSHAAWRRCPSLLGIRGPKATWAEAYSNARAASNSFGGRAGASWHAAIAVSIMATSMMAAGLRDGMGAPGRRVRR